MTASISAEKLAIGYDGRRILDGLDVDIPTGSFTVIIGPNACGKSTLLRSLARMLKPLDGTVQLDGTDIRSLGARDVARRLGLLAQSPIAPDSISVADLVARGRFPHQGLLRQWSDADETAVSEAMQATGITALAERGVDELSGGQRQRVWLAMTLAQQTPLMLLDEPTTFLDIAHQIEVLDLCAQLHQEQQRTLVAVLHDINQAARYATHLIAMRQGEIVASGNPREVITEDLIEQVFGVRCRIIEDPETLTPLMIPAASQSASVAV
ncbi:ABC transporter ATP-binding protein [Rudaeicoccus suwonensis]|uniref:Iron complex transport system ATP-binding protein n=1 Tax=Rudaeicoccus suwonensis TaxID=657409 RepID=A0A561E7Z0_9MICO|nr:ABC transporter ATP-binding protein [Rudaeicoccus suwonensis]TWE11735.1 iron complex transport system ATP-binding protein [Rudaeicoccus suwonensis]